MKYKDYTGIAWFDEDAEVFYGEVIDVRDVITFEGKSVKELKQAFKDSVDDYLAFCKELGKKPEKPFSGKLILRMEPELHRRIYERAKKDDLSLNRWIEQSLERAV